MKCDLKLDFLTFNQPNNQWKVKILNEWVILTIELCYLGPVLLQSFWFSTSLFWILLLEVVYLSKPASQETQRWTIRPADPDVVVHKRAIEPPQSLILKRPRIQSSGDEIFERFPFFFLKNSIHLFCTRRRRREDQRFVFLVEQVWGPTGEASERRRGFKK